MRAEARSQLGGGCESTGEGGEREGGREGVEREGGREGVERDGERKKLCSFTGHVIISGIVG